MGALELKNNLIERFNQLIEDDSKLSMIEGFFDAINSSNSNYSIPEEHYKIIEERRAKYLAGESKGIELNQLKSDLKNKYGF